MSDAVESTARYATTLSFSISHILGHYLICTELTNIPPYIKQIDLIDRLSLCSTQMKEFGFSLAQAPKDTLAVVYLHAL